MIISRVPLRMSFLGGGSDFPEHFENHGGTVLATAIDKYVYVTVAPFMSRFYGNRFKLVYKKTELCDSVDQIEHPVIREAIRMICPEASLELHIIADLPAQTGLGGSSSFTVALLQVLYAFTGKLVSSETLARQAIEIERIILKEHGGYQDQITAAYGGINLVEFFKGGRFNVQRLPLSMRRCEDICAHCLILYTGIMRNSFDVLKTQVERNTAGNNTSYLVRLAELAHEGATYLAGNNDLSEFGKFLHEGWCLKRQLADLSLAQIDHVYDKAISLGASGGKLLGAGKGGFLLFWAPPDLHEKIIIGLNVNMEPLRVSISAPGATIIHAY